MLESGLGFAVFVNSGSDQAFTAIYKVRDLLFDQGQLLLGNLPTPPPSTSPALASGGGGQPSLLFLFLLFAVTLPRCQFGDIAFRRKYDIPHAERGCRKQRYR